mmetsp:Transcript_587/g.1204  ORF Transcript_587/g.1204 Transcript_587/m.1204 type:complete len:368 (+) Transcript_587:359-1462(+)
MARAEFFWCDVSILLISLGVRQPLLVFLDILLKRGNGSRSGISFRGTLFDGSPKSFQLGQLSKKDVLLSVESIFVQPVLGIFVLLQEGILFGISGIHSQTRIHCYLVSHIVNVRFEIVSHVGCFLNDAVSGSHRGFRGSEFANLGIRPFQWLGFCVVQIGSFDLLLLFGGRLSLFAFFCCFFLRGFFFLYFFHHLRRTQLDNSVKILLHVDSNLLLLTGWQFDVPVRNLLGGTSFQSITCGRCVVAAANLEFTIAAERDTSHNGEVESSTEHDNRVRGHVRSFGVNFHALLALILIPRELDRECSILDNFIWQDFEARRKNRGLQSSTAGDGFIGVHSGGHGWDTQNFLQLFLKETNAGASTNNFDR